MNRLVLAVLRVTARVPFAYEIARKIVDVALNRNNCDSSSNGEMAFVARNAGSFSVIFDVGANVGEWTKRVADLCPAARIFSFEPVARTYRSLAGCATDRILTFQMALGDSNGVNSIFVSERDSTLNSVFSRESVGVVTPERIEVRTIDAFCAEHGVEHISLLKIDTEGNELNVLKGARSLVLARRVDVIQFEYGGTYINARILLKDVFDFFRDTDYALFRIFPNHVKRVPEYSQELEDFQYSNYLAIKRSHDYR